MVTHRSPDMVNLPPGSSAYILTNKYRCDLGDIDVATSVRVIPPDESEPLSVPLPQDSVGMAFCGHGDPGSTLDVSPVEPTAQATARVNIAG
jgi:hypothetical protein